jgi:RHS repeat-associated protein
VAVTNSSGTLTSQQRYLPFGGTRAIPNSPILGTDFGYTGQRLLDSGMGGIMDYKARFYSVGLGRFIQPDNIIPYPVNPQSWNRFSYVINNPIRFSDPTGHRCEPEEECRSGGWAGKRAKPLLIFETEGTRVWKDEEMAVLNAGAQDVAQAFARDINAENRLLWKSGDIEDYEPITPTEAFYQVYGGPVKVVRKAGSCSDIIGDIFPDCGGWGYSHSKNEIWIFDNATTAVLVSHPRLIVHELGHSFDKISGMSSNMPSGIVNRDGFYGEAFQWQLSDQDLYTEIYADVFVGWVYGKWGINPETRRLSDPAADKAAFMALMVLYIPVAK